MAHLPRPLTLWAGLAFPAVLVTITHGQNAFLTTALFGWGLLLLPRGPVAAGILFGLLTFKPQVGVLLPVALVAGGHWRAIVAAALTGIALAVTTTVLFGAQSGRISLQARPTPAKTSKSGVLPYYKLQSVFAAVRLLCGPLIYAYVLQGLAADGGRRGRHMDLARPGRSRDEKRRTARRHTSRNALFP